MSQKDPKMKLPKFDPPIKPRYLPNEIHEGLRQADFRSYKFHRLTVANAKPKIDNKPPQYNVDVYYRNQLMSVDARTDRFLYRYNLDIVKKINTIARLGGKVDCWNFKDKKLKTEQDLLKMEYAQIERVNRNLYEKINSLTSELSPQVIAQQWKVLKKKIIEKQRFPWYKEVSRYPSITKNAIKPTIPKEVKRSRCFFDLELGSSNLQLGRIIFELYNDYVPTICANFEAFCEGFNGLSYKGTPFHRILSGYYCQGGDVTKFNGIGGASINVKILPDENFTLQHSCPGVLSTYNEDKNVLDSKFHLTFRPLKTMNGKNIVFGKIVKGLPNLLKVNAYGTKFGKPLENIIVANCGIFPLKSKARGSSN